MAQEKVSVVADASVVLKWQLDDEDCIAQATALRDDFFAREVVNVIAPHLLVYEVVNGIATAARRRPIAGDQAIEALSNLMALGIDLREVDPLMVLEMSLRYNLAAYDAAYLALAEAAQCDLWTGDRALYEAVRGESARVRWVGDYRTPAT